MGWLTFLKGSAPAAPASGKVALFVDSDDGAPKYVDDAGTVHDLKGAQGDQGDAGTAATIAAGSTTTLDPGDPATVTNSGTSSAAVFDFGIPKGDKGDAGEPGADGHILTVVSLGSVSGAVAIDLSAGHLYDLTLGGNTTLSWSNLPAAGKALAPQIRIHQTSGTTYTLTMPASGTWPGAYPLQLSDASSADTMDEFGATVLSDGTWTGYPVEDIG
jgi:hypothetical protein